MAVQMRTVVGDLTAKWHKSGFDLRFGVGIAHGYATLGRQLGLACGALVAAAHYERNAISIQ